MGRQSMFVRIIIILLVVSFVVSFSKMPVRAGGEGLGIAALAFWICDEIVNMGRRSGWWDWNFTPEGKGGYPYPYPYPPPSGVPAADVAVSADPVSIPLDGISNSKIFCNVKVDDVPQDSLPYNTKLFARHSNSSAILISTGSYDTSFDQWWSWDFIYISRIYPRVIAPNMVSFIYYSIASSCQSVRLYIYDKFGGLVYSIAQSQPDPSAANYFTWNGRDLSGYPVSAGGYSIKLRALLQDNSIQDSSAQTILVTGTISPAFDEVPYEHGQSKLLLTSPPLGQDVSPDFVSFKLVDAYGAGSIYAYGTAVVSFYNSQSPVDPFRSTISANPTQINADGSSYSTITVVAKDFSDAPLVGKIVMFTSSRGSLDQFSVQNAATDANGIVTTQVRSSSPGTSAIAAIVDGVTLSNTAQINFAAVGNPAGLVAEAQRYVNCASWWYFRRDITDTIGPPPQNCGVIYSYGNKDDIALFNMKLNKSPGAQNWAGYLYKTGLFYEEWDENKPYGYWAGIDCSGLVQRCANAAGYKRIPVIINITGGEPFRVDPTTVMNRFYETAYSTFITGMSGSLDYSLIKVGDIIHFPSLGGGAPQHYAIVANIDNMYDPEIINAYFDPNEPFNRRVLKFNLSRIKRSFDVYRLLP
jgi:cell wall-associated NlpC family hydrolase